MRYKILKIYNQQSLCSKNKKWYKKTMHENKNCIMNKHKILQKQGEMKRITVYENIKWKSKLQKVKFQTKIITKTQHKFLRSKYYKKYKDLYNLTQEKNKLI